MIRRISFSCLLGLATPLVALAVLGFSGCSGDGNANMAPVEGEAADSPEIEAIKKSGKPPQEIRRLILEKTRGKSKVASKIAQGKTRGRP